MAFLDKVIKKKYLKKEEKGKKGKRMTGSILKQDPNT